MRTARPAMTTPSLAPLRLQHWVDRHELGAFFLLTFTISWTLWLLSYVADGMLAVALFLLGGFGPMTSAVLLTRYRGYSLKEWIRTMMVWRVPARFYGYALGLPLLVWSAINVELALLGQDVDVGLLPGRLLEAAGTFLVVLTVGGALEEPGWRGFALPRLQLRMSPVRATFLLGVVWGLWHVPVYGPLAPFLITALAFFYTYLYNRTGSVLLVILLHATITPANDTLILVPRDVHGVTDIVIFGTVAAVAAALVILTRGRLGYRQEA
jgi:uncharacterized protein